MHSPTAPGDYDTTMEIIHLFNTPFTLSVSLQIDSVYEAVEVFYADLKLQSTPVNVVVDPISSRAKLLIIDNNRKHLKETNSVSGYTIFFHIS